MTHRSKKSQDKDIFWFKCNKNLSKFVRWSKVLRWKCIALKGYFRKEEITQESKFPS